MKLLKLRRPLLWTAALLALSLVFMAYLNPALMVSLSEQLWACF